MDPAFSVKVKNQQPLSMMTTFRLVSSIQKATPARLKPMFQTCQRFFSDRNIDIMFNFEIEGGIQLPHQSMMVQALSRANHLLYKYQFNGKIKPEFWPGQWEYATDYSCGEVYLLCNEMQRFMSSLGLLFQPHPVVFEPVMYGWDTGDIICDQYYFFSPKKKIIHIPNSIQINISLWHKGVNLLQHEQFAWHLQNVLLDASENALFTFIPDQAALDRLFLTDDYPLANELSSPKDISGGHQGSIACYREKNKKNAANNHQVLIYGPCGQDLVVTNPWHDKARIEFRLASSTPKYNVYLHSLFLLHTLMRAYQSFDRKQSYERTINPIRVPRFYWHPTEDSILGKMFHSDFYRRLCQEL